MPQVNSAGRYAHIDAMRAVAVLLVVVAHAGLGGIVPGGSGVTIFFAISGFIITHLLIGERERTGGFSPTRFYFRRAAKIFPPFLAIIVIPSLLWAPFGDLSLGGLLSQIFFVFNWAALAGVNDVLPGSGIVWSLAVEEQFYIAFAVLWACILRLRSWDVALAVLAVAALVTSLAIRIALTGDPGMEERISYGTDTRMDGLALGVLTALAIARSRTSQRLAVLLRPFATDAALILAGAAYLASIVIRDETFRDTGRYTLQAVAACVVIIFGLAPGRGPLRRAFESAIAWKPVQVVGLSSYSIYLAHFPVAKLLAEGLGWAAPAARVPILIVAGVAVGVATYYALEVPVLRWRKRRAERGLYLS